MSAGPLLPGWLPGAFCAQESRLCGAGQLGQASVGWGGVWVWKGLSAPQSRGQSLRPPQRAGGALPSPAAGRPRAGGDLLGTAGSPPLAQPPLLVPHRYRVTQAELFALLCRLADELLFRQIAWVKKLPFFGELSVKDCTCLLSATWQELLLLSSLTVYSKQVFGDLAGVTAKYSPSDDELHR